MSNDFEVTTIIANTPPEDIYAAWLDSEKHAKMTGAGANVSDVVEEEFEAWDGYITGKNLELEPGKRIVQSWRTSEFQDSEGDSKIEVTFKAVGIGTKITLRHSDLPAHGGQYEQGWDESYFQPMKTYFEG